MEHIIQERGVTIRDNVTVTVTDAITGQILSTTTSHNEPLAYAFNTLSQWFSGTNNTGYNALVPPTQIQLGNGTGSTFTPVSGTLKDISYNNFVGGGQSQVVVQYTSTDPSGTFTQAQFRDTNGNAWFLDIFSADVTKTDTQNLTLQWDVTFQS